MEAGLGQRIDEGMARAEQRAAVGLLDGEPAERALTHGQGEGVGGGLEARRVVGPRQQGLAASLDVEDEVAVDEDDERPGLAARLVPLAAGAARSVSSAPSATGRSGQGSAAP